MGEFPPAGLPCGTGGAKTAAGRFELSAGDKGGNMGAEVDEIVEASTWVAG